MKYGFAAFVLLVASAAVAQSQFVYSNDNEGTSVNKSMNTVSAFSVGADGSLAPIAGSPFKTGGTGGGNNIDPEEIAVALKGGSGYLYAANDGSGTIAAFQINPSTGSLTAVSGSPFLADGPPGGDYSLTATPDGKFLFAASDSATVIHIYAITGTGGLQEVGAPFPTGENNQGLKVTPNGAYLLVGEGSLSAVGVYSISASGSLAAVPGSPFATSASPFDLTVNCAGNQVFVIDNGGLNGNYSLIDAFSLAGDGSLTPVPGEPFYNGTSSTSGGLALSPNNRFLFVTDTFSSDISSLGIGSDGTLTQVPGSPFATSSWTGGVAVTHSGKYVYSALFTVAQVDGRAVNSNGELTAVPGTPFSTGQSQTGVPTVITFPPASCSPQ